MHSQKNSYEGFATTEGQLKKKKRQSSACCTKNGTSFTRSMKLQILPGQNRVVAAIVKHKILSFRHKSLQLLSNVYFYAVQEFSQNSIFNNFVEISEKMWAKVQFLNLGSKLLRLYVSVMSQILYRSLSKCS